MIVHRMSRLASYMTFKCVIAIKQGLSKTKNIRIGLLLTLVLVTDRGHHGSVQTIGAN